MYSLGIIHLLSELLSIYSFMHQVKYPVIFNITIYVSSHLCNLSIIILILIHLLICSSTHSYILIFTHQFILYLILINFLPNILCSPNILSFCLSVNLFHCDTMVSDITAPSGSNKGSVIFQEI